MATLEERVKKIIKDQLDIEDKEFVPHARLVEDFRADSLDLVEIMMALEQEFGLKFGSIDVKDVLTIRDTLTFLKQHGEE